MITENNEIKTYKRQIIELIERCNSLHWLKVICTYVHTLLD